MTSFSPRHLLTFAAVSLACASIAPAAQASHSWNGYHWAGPGNGINLKLGDNVSSTWEPILATTSSDWSVSDELNTSIVAGAAGTVKKCRPNAGRVEVCNSNYGSNGWLGVAQIWISGAHITQGTVKLNDSYFNSTRYNYNSTEWRNLVSCQEVGHTFGLDHQDENFSNTNLKTCMDYTNDPSTNQHPNAHDYEELGIIYNHNDGFTTVDQSVAQMPAWMSDLDLSEPQQWGKLVKKSMDGRHAKYARDLGDGYQVHTFVIWVDEKDAKKN
jgi:hypothetical protein